jgi:hypothetical protein
MSDSLVVSGSIELLGGGVASTIPACAGAIFRLQQGFDLSAPQPTTDFVASLILDGERPFGRRSSNRTIALPILIVGTSRTNLAAAREVLEQAIDQDQWTLTWTRDPGPGGTALPLVIDCFRAQPSKPVYNTLIEKQLNMLQIDLTIPALPYGRSDTQQQIAFASPVPSSYIVPPPPPSAVTIDTFTTIASTQCQQSSQCVVGPFTAMWDPDSPLVGDPGGQVTPFAYGPVTLNPAVNLAGLTALQVWAGFGSRYYWALDYHHRTAGVQVAVTLTDTSGNTLSFSRGNLIHPVSPSWGQPVFSQVTIPIPQGSTEFNYAAVASYSLLVTNKQYPVPRLGWVTCYLDHLVAVPPSQSFAPVTRGYVYTLSGLQGTARAPMSLTFQQPPTAGTPSTLSSAGAGSYTVPAGTAWLNVAATGGGGAGASVPSSGQGGGGGGGEFAGEGNFAASPGQVIPYVVGAGGTSGSSPVDGQASVFGPGPSGSLQVAANGGKSAAYGSATAGQGGSGSGNSAEYPGGAGRTATGGLGGGGGSSAGPASAGNSPVGTGSLTFTTSGSWLCPSGVTQVFAECWAGGGGGGGGSSGNGAGGGGGEYRASFISVTPGNNYSYAVGSGGSGGSSGSSGSAGGLSSFTGDGGSSVIAEPGHGGQGNTFGFSGGGSGGSGGTGAAGFSGGEGGSAYPYSGGGGSSAGPSAAGNQGSSPGGATAPPGAGSGGAGSGARAANGTAGSVPGGGGGGTYDTGFTAGSGAHGQVRITYPAGIGAPTSAGAAAVSGGGAGGAGGASAGTNGSAGSTPGGAGGGGNSGGSAQSGGAGAAGQIVVTPYASQPVKTLIVHRPPLGAAKMFQPLVSVGGGNDTPNGATQYNLPQPVAGVNATFSGTYTVYLVNASWNGTGSRTVTVTVTQYEYNGGPSYTVSTAPVSFTPSQISNGIVTAGVLTLPVKAVAADNTAGYYTVSVTDTNTSDRFFDAIFLDTMGQTIVVNESSGSGYLTYYVDAPDPNVALGQVLGSWNGRPSAISVMDACQAISGGPPVVEPADGANQLFAYCADGVAPAISVSFSPSWFFDRFE